MYAARAGALGGAGGALLRGAARLMNRINGHNLAELSLVCGCVSVCVCVCVVLLSSRKLLLTGANLILNKQLFYSTCTHSFLTTVFSLRDRRIHVRVHTVCFH